MAEILRGKLTKSDVKNRYVHIRKDKVKQFPKKPFKITVGGLELTKRIDKYNRIFLNVKDFAKEGDTIIFSKNPDGSYQVLFEAV